MKNLFIIATIGFLTTSCGVVEKLDKNCGNDIHEACNFIFGTRNDDQDKTIKDINNKNSDQDQRMTEIENKIKDLELLVENNFNDLQLSHNSLESLIQANDDQLSDEITALQNLVNNQNTSLTLSLLNLTNQMITSQAQIVTMQGNITSLTTNYTTLSAIVNNLNTQNTVNMIIDPCGSSSGFNEVILKTNNGDYLAYFENGSKRFLTKLTAGNYVTTDGTNCHFTITNSGNLTY